MLLLWPKHMPLELSRDWQDMSVDDWGDGTSRMMMVEDDNSKEI